MAVATISVNFASQAEVLAGTISTKSISPATLLPAISSTGIVQLSAAPGLISRNPSNGIASIAPNFNNLNTKLYAASGDSLMILDTVSNAYLSTTFGRLSGAISRFDQGSFTIAKPLAGDSFILFRTTYPIALTTTPTYTVGTGTATVTISPTTGILQPGQTMTATVDAASVDVRNIVISFGFRYI